LQRYVSNNDQRTALLGQNIQNFGNTLVTTMVIINTCLVSYFNSRTNKPLDGLQKPAENGTITPWALA